MNGQLSSLHVLGLSFNTLDNSKSLLQVNSCNFRSLIEFSSLIISSLRFFISRLISPLSFIYFTASSRLPI